MCPEKSRALRGLRVLVAQCADFRLERGDPTPICFDRLDQAVKCRMQIVIALISKRDHELSGRVSHKCEIAFFGEHALVYDKERGWTSAMNDARAEKRRGVYLGMKTGTTAIATLSLAAATLMLTGCTTETTTRSTTTTAQTQPDDQSTIKQTYTQSDLQRSGRATTGPALRQIDPDVR